MPVLDLHLPASRTSSDSGAKHQHSLVLLSCSFGLQAAYVLLSGIFVNDRVEAEQSKHIRRKPEDIFSIKYDPVCLKLLFCAT